VEFPGVVKPERRSAFDFYSEIACRHKNTFNRCSLLPEGINNYKVSSGLDPGWFFFFLIVVFVWLLRSFGGNLNWPQT
jgi:hypothetical protein